MIQAALLFLVLALIAAVLGLGGIANISIDIALILFVVGLVLAIIAAFTSRRRPMV